MYNASKDCFFVKYYKKSIDIGLSNYTKTKYCYLLNKIVEILINMCYYILCINLIYYGRCLIWEKVYLTKKSLVAANTVQTHR